jgi:hypothetical protein
MSDSAASGHASWAQQLEVATRVAAGLIAAAYVAGFLIVTIHHARLGIWQFDLLRPRILSAGTTFLVLLFLAAATTLGAHRLLGIGGVGLPREPHKQQAAATLVTIICSTTTAYGFALFLRGMLASEESWRFWIPWQPIPLMLLVGGIDFAARVRIDKGPTSFLLSAAAAAVALGGAVWSYATRFTSTLALWFWIVMVLVLVIYAVGRYQEALLRNQRLESILLVATIGMIYLYSAQIYGAVNPWLGGGAPMSVTFILSAPAPTAETIEGRLIEETTHGYYLLPDTDPTRPLFSLAKECQQFSLRQVSESV